MTKSKAFTWLPQPSTVIGLGILAGTSCYLITGDPVWAGIAAAVVKILIPDNSTGGERAFEAIAMLAQTAGRPLKAGSATVGCLRRSRQKSGPAVPGGTGKNDERPDERPRLIGGRDHATLWRNREGRASR